MRANMLKLNDSKTEVLVISTRQQIKKDIISSLNVGDSCVGVSSHARNLGVVFDSQLSMDAHIDYVCKSAYFTPHNISKIRKYFDRRTA